MLKTVFSVPHSAFKHWPLGFLPPPIFLEISSPFFTSSLFILGDVLCLQNKATDFFFYSVISSPISSLTDGFFSLLLFAPVKHRPTRHHSRHVYNSIKFQSVIYTQFYFFFFHTRLPLTYSDSLYSYFINSISIQSNPPPK